MGLLTTYDNSINKETSQALQVTYSVQQSDQFEGYWIVTRTATKYYSYVGMTYAAAKFCADEKIKQYTRPYARVIAQNNLSGEALPEVVYATECKSSISAKKTSGNMWQTVIQVNEYDEKFSTTEVQNPELLFGDENAREYDEEESGNLRIVDVLQADYVINEIQLMSNGIPNFPQYGGAKLCAVQINRNYPSSDVWELMQYNGTGWVIGNTISDNMAIRCLYGPYKSNDYRLA